MTTSRLTHRLTIRLSPRMAGRLAEAALRVDQDASAFVREMLRRELLTGVDEAHGDTYASVTGAGRVR